MKPKQELIRVVRGPKGDIDIDQKGKSPGRGAYLCCNLQCIEKAEKHNLFEHTFHQKIEQDIYCRLKNIVIEGDEDI